MATSMYGRRTNTYLLRCQRTLPERNSRKKNQGTTRACKNHVNTCSQKVARSNRHSPLAVCPQNGQRHTQQCPRYQARTTSAPNIYRHTSFHEPKALVPLWLPCLCPRRFPTSRKEDRQMVRKKKNWSIFGSVTTTRKDSRFGPITRNRTYLSSIPYCRQWIRLFKH